MSDDYYGFDEDDTFMDRHGGKVATGVCLLLGLGVALWMKYGKSDQPESKAPEVTLVNIMPPPPPPPPPPPTPKPPEPEPEPPEVQEKEETFVPEEAPMEQPEPEAAPEPEPAAMGTNIAGDGPPDGFGLRAGGGGGMIGGTGTGKRLGGGGSKYGWYAGKVQGAVTTALRNHPTTRSAVMSIEVKIWADQLGRVTRAQLVNSTGDRGMDDTLSNQILASIQLPEPPPADMPMPINLRITARQP